MEQKQFAPQGYYAVILDSVENQHGDEIVTQAISVEDGVFEEMTLNCLSSKSLEMGTCLCVNHPIYLYRLLTSDEVEKMGFIVESLTFEQRVFDTFHRTLDDIRSFCEISYKMGLNPLPHLRKLANGAEIEFQYANIVGSWKQFEDGHPFWLVVLKKEGDDVNSVELIYRENY